MDDTLSNEEGNSVIPLPVGCGGVWYAIHTRARHEKKVAEHLAEKRISAFLPTALQTHVWSDRKKVVEVPLFSCYVFVQAETWRQVHMPVLTTPGVLRWVGVHGEPAPIPEAQISAVRSVVSSGVSATPHPFLQLGQRVRVCTGSLNGVEGVLVKKNGDNRLVVSIDLIQQSMSVTLDGYEVVPV
jgi:transcription antitermination factor NusG